MITTEQENRGLSSFRHKKGRAGTPHSLSDVEKLLYNWEEEKNGSSPSGPMGSWVQRGGDEGKGKRRGETPSAGGAEDSVLELKEKESRVGKLQSFVDEKAKTQLGRAVEGRIFVDASPMKTRQTTAGEYSNTKN